MAARLAELRRMQDEFLAQQQAAMEEVRKSTEAAQQAREEYEKAEAHKKKIGDKVDKHQATIRQMAEDYKVSLSWGSCCVGVLNSRYGMRKAVAVQCGVCSQVKWDCSVCRKLQFACDFHYFSSQHESS